MKGNPQHVESLRPVKDGEETEDFDSRKLVRANKLGARLEIVGRGFPQLRLFDHLVHQVT